MKLSPFLPRPAKAPCAIPSPPSIRPSPAAATRPRPRRRRPRPPRRFFASWTQWLQVTTALADQNGAAMLALVDELERNGGSPQHFSRELSRYIRNLLVTKIAGTDSRLVTASPAERASMANIAAQFSEEDLTRYLQLSLDLFRDLQFSLQPRFHLEIGLLKMVQAGKLIGIEEALASLGPQPAAPVPAPRAVAPPATPARTGPSPFDLDRQKKTAAPPAPATPPAAAAAPSPDDDWRGKIYNALLETGLKFSADAMAQASASLINGELQIAAPKEFQLDLGREEISTALKHLGHPGLRFKVTFGAVASAEPPPASAPKAVTKENEVTERAMAHPEVQRFRELFGGEVRTVRNLKEPWNDEDAR